MNRNKAKGSRAERKIVKLFSECGYQALRSPASLSKTDILVNGFGTIQVKYRKSFLPLYKALSNTTKDVLIICDGLYGTYLENVLYKKELNIEINLKHRYQLEKLREGQDWLVIGTQYKAFLIFTKEKDTLLKVIKSDINHGQNRESILKY